MIYLIDYFQNIIMYKTSLHIYSNKNSMLFNKHNKNRDRAKACRYILVYTRFY